MKTNEKNLEVLNDLIWVNEKRAAEYEKVIQTIDSIDRGLKPIFNSLAAESLTYANELSRYILYVEGNTTEPGAKSGTVYKSWKLENTIPADKSRKSVLASCESVEAATQKAYKQALQSDADARLTPAEKHVIEEQKNKLQTSYKRIRMMLYEQSA